MAIIMVVTMIINSPNTTVMQITRTVRPTGMLIARTVRTPWMLIATVVLIVRKRTRMMMFNSLKPPAVKTNLLLDPTRVLVANANYVKIAQKKKKREREAVIVVLRPTVMLKVRKKTRVMMLESLRPP